MRKILNTKLLKLAFALLLLVILFRSVDTEELILAVRSVRLIDLVYLLLISVVLVYVSALKWGLILKSSGQSYKTIKLFMFYLLGYFVNTFLPSFIGGDAARSYLISKDGERTHALAATIIERLTGLFAMVILGTAFFFLTDLKNIYLYILIAFLFTLVVTLVISLKLDLKNINLRFKILEKFRNILVKLQLASQQLLSNKPLLVKTLALSLVFHSFTVLNTYVAGLAVGWTEIPVLELFIFLPMILIISFIPITPAGLGVQEGAFVYFLTQLGATPAQALSISLVLRAKHMILAAIGGVYFFMLKRNGEKIES